MAERLRHAGVEFCITRPKPKLLSALKRSGLYDVIGAERVFSRRKVAIQTMKEKYGDEIDVRHLVYYRPVFTEQPSNDRRDNSDDSTTQ